MKVRRLDDNHDWTFGNGRADYATMSEAISQSVLTKLLSLRHDWFLDLEHGLRWLDYLKKNPNLIAMESAIKSQILNVDGVVRITAFDIQLNPDPRKFTISATYIDIYGNKNEVNTDAPNNR
ncbi:hypothetical protein [uncultured Providencia sp.]|uniref:hypothetical protein n=1 Tax=uncultured Providencia sp. TaxID=390517 RepID=UPI002804CA72|nr:hypothetical protein [uncultured Providencia sp.]